MQTLGRKQRSQSEDFAEAFRGIRDWYPQERIAALAEQAARDLRSWCRAAGPRLAISWSGGKDSQVLRYIADTAGVTDAVLVVSELEVPEFLRWVDREAPDGLTVVNTGQGLDWLAGHPRMLFPKDANTAGQWFRVVQHTGQRRYFQEHRLDGLLLGRRWADGNYTGKGGGITYTDRYGVVRHSPLAAWSHEDVLAAIAWFELPLAPCYAWPRGFRVGTGPWPKRRVATDEQGWREVHAIDPSIVEAAAGRFPGARVALGHDGR